MATKIEIGDTIPQFSLTDQNGNVYNSLKDNKGKTTVIYFYPKDESGICTKEACAFRDSYSTFTDAGIDVIGINNADEKSHKKFADKNRLPFRLLSDYDNKVLKLFGVKNALFLTGRETFIVNNDGIVIYKFRDFFNGEAHLNKVVKFLEINKI